MLVIFQGQRAYGGPDLGRGGPMLVDEVEDLRTNAVVEPQDDMSIVLEPSWIGRAGRRGEVLSDRVLLEHDLKKSPPLREVWRVEGQN